MKKLLLIILLTGAALGQCTPTTGNIGLATPSYGTTNWNTCMNTNYTIIDSILSGGTNAPALNVTNNITAGGNITSAGTGSFLSLATTGTGPGLITMTGASAAGTPLTACASGNVGTLAYVLDASSLTPGTAYSVSAGAGTKKVYVECAYSGSTYAWQTI